MGSKKPIYYIADGKTSEVLEETSKKERRSKSNITNVIMSEWANGKYGDIASIKPEQPTQGQGQGQGQTQK